jgi:hypothetical protein
MAYVPRFFKNPHVEAEPADFPVDEPGGIAHFGRVLL